MLDISKPLTAGKVKSYYRAEYSSASNSYFTEGGTLQGNWHGQLASALHLSGPVTGEAFDRLAEGQHPQTGEQLIQHRDTIKTQSGEELGHRAGWDLTFNAPKTVSLTALVGEDDRVRQAHRHAVEIALDATEKYVQARIGGNHAAETTGKWIAATFEHDTARPVEGYAAPHLHTHAVVFNMTEDQHGQARSLQPYELFRVQSMATAVYQNQLEHELRRLGYGIQRGTNHAPDIKGYSPDYLQAESLRTSEIKQAMEERGAVGREAESHIKHQNREAKLNLSPEELRAHHKSNAEEYGNQPAAVVAEAAHRNIRELSADRTQAQSQAAVSFARDRLSERNSVFEHFEVIRDALRHTHGRATLQDVERELSRQTQDQKFARVEHIRPNAPAYRYTTPELIQTERETIEQVMAGKGQAQPIAAAHPAEIQSRFGEKLNGEKLNDDQRRIVHQALSTTDQISGLQGRAGTGKTTALSAIVKIAEENGYVAHGLGPTSRAAKGLQEAGMQAETLQMYLTTDQQSRGVRPRMFFVDESSLTASKAMHSFLRTIRPQDRVLLIGDTRQHQSVEAGRIFEQLQDAGMQTAQLTKIVRQKEEGLRHVVEAMVSGQVEQGLDLLRAQDRIHSNSNRKDRFREIAQTFAEHPAGTLVVSPDNQSRKELNIAIRSELRKGGLLAEQQYDVAVHVSRQNITGEDRGIASSYHAGDAVRYLRGSQTYGLEAKSYATVISTNSEQNLITVRKTDGQFVTYDPGRVKGVAIYEPEIRSFSQGDRIQFTAPWRDQAIATRETGTVLSLDPQGNIRVKVDESDRTVSWNFKTNKHVDHAYAMTSHSSQGATVDRVLIHVDTSDSRTRALVDQTLAYVAISRPRHDAQVFTDDAERLAKALSRTNQNSTALAPQQVAAYAFEI